LSYYIKPDPVALQAIQTALGTLNTQLTQGAPTTDTDEQLQQLQTQLHTLDQHIIADFQNISQHIQDKQLPDSIQQRQQDAVATYQTAYNDLIRQLTSITNETDTTLKQQGIHHYGAITVTVY